MKIANHLEAGGGVTVTILTNVVGPFIIQQNLNLRDDINSRLLVVLDDATGRRARGEPGGRSKRSTC